jgi:hypothetical protein
MPRKTTAPKKQTKKPRRSKIQLNIRLIPRDPAEGEGEAVPLVLLEGDRLSLKFLGELILEHALHPQDCGIQMWPNGPAGRVFSPNSQMGIYIHRLPCWSEIARKSIQPPAAGEPPKAPD